MPRQSAPPPSGEFSVRLNKPFSGKGECISITPDHAANTQKGTPTHTVEVIGEPNRPASVKITQYTGSTQSSEKAGDVPKDDVQELLSLVSTLRGFPSHPTKDVYGFDTKLEFNTFDIQWSNEDEDPTAGDVSEIAAEQKDDFKRIADSIEALGRSFAKKDAAV